MQAYDEIFALCDDDAKEMLVRAAKLAAKLRQYALDPTLLFAVESERVPKTPEDAHPIAHLRSPSFWLAQYSGEGFKNPPALAVYDTEGLRLLKQRLENAEIQGQYTPNDLLHAAFFGRAPGETVVYERKDRAFGASTMLRNALYYLGSLEGLSKAS